MSSENKSSESRPKTKLKFQPFEIGPNNSGQKMIIKMPFEEFSLINNGNNVLNHLRNPTLNLQQNMKNKRLISNINLNLNNTTLRFNRMNRINESLKTDLGLNDEDIRKLRTINEQQEFILWLLTKDIEFFSSYNYSKFLTLLRLTNFDINIQTQNIFSDITFNNSNSEILKLIKKINKLKKIKNLINMIDMAKVFVLPPLSYPSNYKRGDPLPRNLQNLKNKRDKIENILLSSEIYKSLERDLIVLFKTLIISLLPHINIESIPTTDPFGNIHGSGYYELIIIKIIQAFKCNRRNINSIFSIYNIEDPLLHKYFGTNGNIKRNVIESLKTSPNKYCLTNVRDDGFCSIWAFIFGYLINNNDPILFNNTKIKTFIDEVLNSDTIITNIYNYLNSKKRTNELAQKLILTNLFKTETEVERKEKIHPIYILCSIHLYCVALYRFSDLIDFDNYNFNLKTKRLIQRFCNSYNFDNIDIEGFNNGFDCLINRLIFPHVQFTINGEQSIGQISLSFDNSPGNNDSIIELRRRLTTIPYMFSGVIMLEEFLPRGKENKYYTDDIFILLSYFLDSSFVQLNAAQQIFYNYTGNLTIHKPLLHIYNLGNHYNSLNPYNLYNNFSSRGGFRNNANLNIWWRNNFIDTYKTKTFRTPCISRI